MLGRRPIAISLLLLSALPLAGVVRAIEVLDVPWRPTPGMDGIIGDAEYPAPSPVSNCSLYLCQDTNYLYVAVSIPDPTYNASDGITICIGTEPPSPERTPRVDDYRMTLSRSGAFTTTGFTSYKYATTTDSGGWRFEVAMGLPELETTPGQYKSLGFALFIRDDGKEVARWPDDADQESPKN